MVERFAPGFWRAWGEMVRRAWAASDGGIQVTSWWRSPSHNREVGGSDDSQHLVGVAFDVMPLERYRRALVGAGFRVVHEGDHLHAQPWPAGVARTSGLLRSLGW
jgi:hypothetical protein